MMGLMCLYKEEEKPEPFLPLPGEHTEGRWQSAKQEEGSQQEPNVLVSWSWTS